MSRLPICPRQAARPFAWVAWAAAPLLPESSRRLLKSFPDQMQGRGPTESVRPRFFQDNAGRSAQRLGSSCHWFPPAVWGHLLISRSSSRRPRRPQRRACRTPFHRGSRRMQRYRSGDPQFVRELARETCNPRSPSRCRHW